MLEMRFDFSTIASRAEFYRCFAEQSGVGAHFGANLDALWDALTGEMALPARIVLCHAPAPDRCGELAAILLCWKRRSGRCRASLRCIIAEKMARNEARPGA